MGAESKDLPLANVKRVVKTKLQELAQEQYGEERDMAVNKDVLLVFSESAKIFIHFLSAMLFWKCLKALCQEAAMLPIRELGGLVSAIKKSELQPLRLSDFRAAMKEIRPSVSQSQLLSFEQWNREFGSG